MDARCREVRIVRDMVETARTAERRQKASYEATRNFRAALESALEDLEDAQPGGEDGSSESLTTVIRRLEQERQKQKPKPSSAEEKAKARATGISKIELSWRADGWAAVIVHDFVTLTLAPSVGALLEQLIAVRDVDEGGFPVFVAKEALRRALGVASHARHGRRPEQAVDQLVYRLRDEFERVHLNRWFIETKGGGVRLLLRRPDPGPSAGIAASNGNAGRDPSGLVQVDHG